MKDSYSSSEQTILTNVLNELLPRRIMKHEERNSTQFEGGMILKM